MAAPAIQTLQKDYARAREGKRHQLAYVYALRELRKFGRPSLIEARNNI